MVWKFITKVENILEHGKQPQQLQPLCRLEQFPCSPLHQPPWAFQATNGSLKTMTRFKFLKLNSDSHKCVSIFGQSKS